MPFSDEELYILKAVNSHYGGYSAPTLRNMSCSDFPGDFDSPGRSVISDNKIRSSFLDNEFVKTLCDAV